MALWINAGKRWNEVDIDHVIVNKRKEGRRERERKRKDLRRTIRDMGCLFTYFFRPSPNADIVEIPPAPIFSW